MGFERAADAIRARMQAIGAHPAAVDGFLRRAALVAGGFSGRVPWSEVGSPEPADLVRFEDLPERGSSQDLSRLVVVKLNGGLGTSMGLSRAKTLLPVKDGADFLTLTVRQTRLLRERHGAPVPLLLMCSKATEADTLAHSGVADVNAGTSGGLPATFLQGWVPRLRADDLNPLEAREEEEGWCPPGHGDVYLSLLATGLLDRLLAAGMQIAFLSNGDNLGASVDDRILGWFLREGLDFAMETTPKTEADLKGGVLFRHRPSAGPSKLGLLEIAQAESGRESDFQDVDRFPHFNTNNLWIRLESLRDRLARGLDLPVIVNPKTVEGTKVLQLETAMGAAIGSFDRTRGIVVPRTRFAPVKTCADLLVRRSDCFVLDPETCTLGPNPARTLGEPMVTLDAAYRSLADFEALVPEVPSLVDAESLVVEGRIRFDRRVRVRGRVKFRNTSAGVVDASTYDRDDFQDETVGS